MAQNIEKTMESEALLLVDELQLLDIGAVHLCSNEIYRQRSFGSYVDLLQFEDEGYLQLWLCHEPGHRNFLLWCGLYYGDELRFQRAINRVATEARPQITFVYHENSPQYQDYFSHVDETVIEMYNYPAAFYMGRFFRNYSANFAAKYVMALLGRDDTYTPEVVAAIRAIENLAAPLKAGLAGQGLGLNVAQRRAVELHAMTLTQSWLEEQGFSYDNVSRTDSYDFLASKAQQDWIVEVKGTTGSLSTILLTKNEVKAHKDRYPHNILIVVHGIVVDEKGKTASGGTLVAYTPWFLDETALTPISFAYRL